MTKAQAWEQVERDARGYHDTTFCVSYDPWEEAFVYCSVGNYTRRRVVCGTGPTPEAAIAAAFGEKITPTCDDCGYHDVQCHCEGLDDDDTTHRERYCPRSSAGLDASECEGFKPLST